MHGYRNDSAIELLEHPGRALFVGKSKGGKTTLMVSVIKNHFAKQVNRIIAVCPTFDSQVTFDPIRKLVKRKDVITTVNEFTIKSLLKRLEGEFTKANRNNESTEKVLIFIDDLAGTSFIHGRRTGAFSTLAVQTRHWNISLFLITQHPKTVDPNFRENAEYVFMYPDDGLASFEWLEKSYTSLLMDKKCMRRVAMEAWNGGNEVSEWGVHFLFVLTGVRTHTRFFIDFDKEIIVR